MKRITLALSLFVLFVIACQPIEAPPVAAVEDEATLPLPTDEAIEEAVEEAVEDAETSMVDVNFYTSHAAHERLSRIDLTSGVATDIGPYANAEIEINRTGWPVGNGAIFEEMFYVIPSKRLPSGSTPEEAQSRLGRVNMQTGEVDLIGSDIGINLMALEIDHCGRMFATGFTLSNQLGEIFGDTNFYSVNREDASLTLIGDTGIERIMDMSFDPDGMLWATVGNVLYTLDIETGAPTEVVTITGVEDDLEIMGIGFTSEGELYGTTPFADGFYQIDTATGEVTEIGRHGLEFMHGGDIPMTPHDTSCPAN